MTTAREPPPDTRCLVHMNISFGYLKMEFMLTIFKGLTVDWFYLGFGVCVCACVLLANSKNPWTKAGI